LHISAGAISPQFVINFMSNFKVGDLVVTLSACSDLFPKGAIGRHIGRNLIDFNGFGNEGISMEEREGADNGRGRWYSFDIRPYRGTKYK